MTPISDKDRDGIRRMVETKNADRIKLAYNLCLSFGMNEIESFEYMIYSVFCAENRSNYTWAVDIYFGVFSIGIQWHSASKIRIVCFEKFAMCHTSIVEFPRGIDSYKLKLILKPRLQRCLENTFKIWGKEIVKP